MKRYGNLWDKITDIENIKLAHKQAKRGKAYYSEVKMVDGDIDKYAKEIQEMLVKKTFTTSKYKITDRFDGRKNRTIYKLPYYPDRIVQHALLNIVGPILVKSFIRDSFQSITGRGTHDGAKRVQKLVNSSECPRYALKIDIKKYYPSVNNDLMKSAIRRKIKDKDVLWLIDNIIDSVNGLPIGNYTSQHFGNMYLNQFDWWMKQRIKPLGYFRYCDDILVFADTTQDLVIIKNEMIKKINDLQLTVKSNWNIYDVHKNGIDFVGYVFKPDAIRLRNKITFKFKEQCKRLKAIITKDNKMGYLSNLMAYKGWVKLANAKMLWRKHMQYFAKFFPKQLKGAI